MTSDADNGIRRLETSWLAEGGEFVHDLAWSPDGASLAVATADGGVAVVNADNGELRWRVEAHPLAATVVTWSPDGRVLASGGQDNAARLWDVADGGPRARLRCGRHWVEGLAWCPDGQLLTASGRELRLWTDDGVLQRNFDPTESTVTGLQWLADGTFLSCCYGHVQQWREESAAAIRDYAWKGSMLALAASPDGRWIAAGCQDRAVQIWDTRSRQGLTMSGYNTKVRSLSWDHSGRYLATDGGGEALIVWDCGGAGPNGREPAFLPAHSDTVNCVRFAHGDSRIASAGEDGLVFVVRVDDQRPLFGLFDSAPVSALSWSADDRRLAIGYASGRVRLCPVPDRGSRPGLE